MENRTMTSKPSFAFLLQCALGAMLTFLISGCGGGGSPAAATPTATSITINSTGTQLFLGATETFSATVTLSNGTTQVVTAGTWSVDAPSVASVSQGGLVTGIASGEVTVILDFQGARGTKRITVRPNYQGSWVGSYAISTCSQSGQIATFVDGCTSTFTSGRVLPLSLNMTQAAATLTGRTSLGTLVSDTFTAAVATNGTTMILATYRSGTLTIDQTWSLASTTAGRITGTLIQTWRDTALTGQMVIAASIFNTNLQSASPLFVDARTAGWLTLPEILLAIQR